MAGEAAEAAAAALWREREARAGEVAQLGAELAQLGAELAHARAEAAAELADARAEAEVSSR